MDTLLHIAIDGPVGAGKSTIAKLLADKLGITFIDTGAMYRSVALAAQKAALDWNDEHAVTELLSELDIQEYSPQNKEHDGRLVTVLLNGEDVSHDIRSAEIAEGASIVSSYAGVRALLKEVQKSLAYDQSVVMEGRDIARNILPNADLKIFLTADERLRAKRKHQESKKTGQAQSFDSVLQALQIRDERERNRQIDPLQPVADSWLLDTSDLTIDQVIDTICIKIQQTVPGYICQDFKSPSMAP